MHIVAASLVVVALTSIGCARAAPAPSIATPRAPAATSMTVAYELRRGDGDGLVFSGRSEIQPGHAAAIEQRRPHESAVLRLEARPQADGTTLLRLRYDEEGSDGTRIDWETSLRVRRGAETQVAADGRGWGRTLRVRVD